MQNIIFRYLFFVGIVSFTFTQFIACGAQLYNTSMKEDVELTKIPAEALDPSSARYGLRALNGWKKLPINFKIGIKLNEEQKTGLVNAMNTWEKIVGKKLFNYIGKHKQTHGDSFEGLYDSLDDKINGDYLDYDWKKTAKSTSVLATTIWENTEESSETIETADIRFNAENYIIADSLISNSTETKSLIDMETLALHELGHLIGLTHISAEVDPDSIMVATMHIGEGIHNRIPSIGDIKRVQSIYGCVGDSCDAQSLLQNLISASFSNNNDDSNTDDLYDINY